VYIRAAPPLACLHPPVCINSRQPNALHTPFPYPLFPSLRLPELQRLFRLYGYSHRISACVPIVQRLKPSTFYQSLVGKKQIPYLFFPSSGTKRRKGDRIWPVPSSLVPIRTPSASLPLRLSAAPPLALSASKTKQALSLQHLHCSIATHHPARRPATTLTRSLVRRQTPATSSP
jgi:hypothetical protein